MAVDSYISDKTTKGKPSAIHGKGFFAKEPIARGEVVAVKGGHLVDEDTLMKLRDSVEDSELQVADDLYITPLTENEVMESMIYCNHSCEPNAGWAGNIVVVTMRDITPGEELTVDYATYMDGSGGRQNFTCNCQQSTCRKRITGTDWQRRDLQEKFKGYFTWFIQQKINNST